MQLEGANNVMKIRRGFVTNSSSTNDIFQALGTAGAAAALGTIINVIQPSKNVEIISYALLETTHLPEEPRPPVIRVNDSEYVAWYYAAVRVIDVQFVTDEDTGEVEITVLRDEYDSNYTSSIEIDIPLETAEKWLTFGTSGSGEGSNAYTTIQGDYKVCGFMCESPANDRPRHQRPTPPSLLNFGVSVNVDGHTLGKSKETNVRDEAVLYASGGYILNDASVTTEFQIVIMNIDKYSWDLSYEINNEKILNHIDVSVDKSKKEISNGALWYDVRIKPNGTKLGTEKEPLTQLFSRMEVTGKPGSSHIEKVWDYMELTLVDEGLFFEGELDKEGRLAIKSFIQEEDEDDNSEKEIPPTSFQLKCVMRCEDSDSKSTAKFIDMQKADINIGDLKGTDNATENLVSAYKYEIKKDGSAGKYIFSPQMQLPSSKTPYHVILPIQCNFDGKTYELDMPIQLMGEPNGNKQAWEEEYKKLRIVIRKYIPPEQWIDILNHVNDNKNKLSIEQLRLMRKSIWETARDQLVAEAAGYENIAMICEWTGFGFECIKWVNDQAFSYVATALYGPLVEAFLTPFKDVMFTLIGEYSVDLFWGNGGKLSADTIAKGSLSGIFTGFENVIMNGAGDNITLGALDMKKLGKYLAAFAAVKCMNHYFCDTKPDGSPVGLWDAIIDTCKDLTVNLFKVLVAKKFEELAKSEKANELFSKYATQQLRTFLTKLYPDWEEKGVEILVKYLSEFGGLISCTAYGKTLEVAGTAKLIQTSEDTILTFDLSSDPKKPILIKLSLNAAKESLYDYIFSSIFGNFPFAPTVVQLTNDPVYYKA